MVKYKKEVREMLMLLIYCMGFAVCLIVLLFLDGIGLFVSGICIVSSFSFSLYDLSLPFTVSSY